MIDGVVRVPDGASVAAMRHLEERFGLSAGPSTGTNLWLTWQLIADMVERGERGSVVTLLCDSGNRYLRSYREPAWLAGKGIDPEPFDGIIDEFLSAGVWSGPAREE